MQNRSLMLGIVSSLAMFCGCDEKQAVTPPSTAPAITTAATKPTSAAAAYPPPQYPSRPPAIMTVDGHDIAFPAAKLIVLGKSAGALNVRLCSDDPPTSIDVGYTGNSFDFDMRLPIDELAALPATVWNSNSQNSTDSDENTGVFLHGYRHEQLRPDDVRVTFAKDGGDILAYVSGTFLHVDTRKPIAPSEHMQINACLRATVSGR